MNRRCILVLGMHRSGTSALTRVLGLLGAELPRETMPPAADNPLGYWESPRVARLNNRLLESAGTAWNDDSAISRDWFDDPARKTDRDEALRLIGEEFPGTGTFACKDPRICRLLPFWRTVFAAADVEPHAVLLYRDPLEVARSLAARAADPSFRPAAVACPERAVLLWLRYMVDAERHSRGLSRGAVEYRGLLADWRAALAACLASRLLPPPGEATAAAVDAFLDPSLRRQRVVDDADAPPRDPRTATQRLLAAWRDDPGLAVPGPAATVCDDLSPRLERLVDAYRPLRRGKQPLDSADPWSAAILASLDRDPPPRHPATERRSVLFLSGVPTSVGHVYRVEHAVAALAARGWRAGWLAWDDQQAPARAAASDLVVVFRAPWAGGVPEVAAACRRRGVPLAYDTDDLIFDPSLMTDGSIAVLAALSEHDRRQFIAAAAGHLMLLERCDAAVLSTQPLAAAAAGHCPRTFVLPNSLDPRMEAAAAAARDAVAKASASDGRPRLVFASGTPSHDRDFAVAAEGIARLFARRPEPRLVVIGHLDVRIYPCLLPFIDRIESRPAVPLLDLFRELAACDVNLCPLEPGNRFCEAKSAVRCLFAAAVGVPSVASPTRPLREAVVPDGTGAWAADATEWERQVERLVADEPWRSHLGEAARVHALAEYGFAAYRERVASVFDHLVDGPRSTDRNITPA